MEAASRLESYRRRIFTIIEIGALGDYASRIYDFTFRFLLS